MFRRLAFVAALLAFPTAAAAQSMNVGIDQASRVQLRGAASSVIVANPTIADVTVVDANTLFITGKGYGVTEVVAVDVLGRTLFQSQVVVSDSTGPGRVRVWRGGQSVEMACGNTCSPAREGAPAAAAAPPPPIPNP